MALSFEFKGYCKEPVIQTDTPLMYGRATVDCIVDASSFLAVRFLFLVLFFTNEYGFPMEKKNL